MDLYLQQFKKLPKELQQAVSSEEKIKNLEEVEKKYNLRLAKLVVRIMIKDILWSDLEKFCQENFKLTSEKSTELKKDLTEKIFNEVQKYLGIEKLVETKIDEDELEMEKVPQEAMKLMETDRYKQPPAAKLVEIDQIIKEIKEKSGLAFTEEILEKRFENIALNFLKEVRKDFETEEILTRSEKIGGLSLSPEKATEIMKILKEKKNELGTREEELGIKVERKPELAAGVLTPEEIIKQPAIEEMPIEESPKTESEKLKEIVPPSIAKIIETTPPKVDKELKQKFDGGTITPIFKKLEKPIRPISNFQFPISKTEEPKTQKEKEEEIYKAPKVKEEEIPIQIRRPMSEEKFVEDVSGRPKALGPVEELKEITLSDLKRWGGQQTCQIILNKINLLAEESLIKKAQGIKAWQKSALYHLYLEIGQESLEKKKSVAAVVAERLAQGQEAMSLEDFEEITELNRKLRF